MLLVSVKKVNNILKQSYMNHNLRVHISPVGFEFRRVTEPLIRMHADKAYLITFSEDDRASNYLKKIENELRVRYSHISLEKKFVDIWDLYECIEQFRSILLAE